MTTRRFTNQQIDRLLRPKSVAVIGASDRHGALGCTLLNNLVQYEFAGDIYPVNPKRDELQGLKVYHTVNDLPHGVDCAVLAIPRPFVVDTVRDLAARGCGAVVVYAAGFTEAGEEGARDQAELPWLHQLRFAHSAQLCGNQHAHATCWRARRGCGQPVGRIGRRVGDHTAFARLLCLDIGIDRERGQFGRGRLCRMAGG